MTLADLLKRNSRSLLSAARLEQAPKDAASVIGPIFHGFAPARRRALEAMAYQLGREGLAGFAGMITAVRAGDWAGASADALCGDWLKDAPGLARDVSEMLMSGQMPAEG